MPGHQRALPPWSPEAQEALKAHHKSHAQAIQRIAYGLAVGERTETVVVRHVDEAARVLAAGAHSPKPWYKRHEAEVAIGGILLGAAGAIPDWFGGFFPDDSPWRRAIEPVMMAGLVIVGGLLMFHGWLCRRGFFVND